ncbi:MAG: uroporphyrinogen decarboxylase family protein [Chloroflexota bacterium]
MLPKERMLAAFHHEEPDRVPIGELASDYEMTERVLGHPTYYRSKWKEYVAEWEGRRDEIAWSYGHDIAELAVKLGWDFIVVNTMPGRTPPPKPEMLGPYKWRDHTGKVYVYDPDTGGHAMLIEAPPMTIDQLVIPEQFEVDSAQLEAIAQTAKDYGQTHFVVGRLPESSFAWRQTIGMEAYLTSMIEEPEFVAKAEELYGRRAVAVAEEICKLDVCAIVECSDYCGNMGPIMGPRFFRQFIKPWLAEIVRVAHAHGKYFLKHTDGDTWSILDDLVEIGVDAWQGIQPSIGMDLKRLKERYGQRLTFFGGVNNETLIAGTPAEVEAEVRYAFRHAAPGGGYVLTSGNTLQPGTNYDNYMAMLRAGRELGKYPVRV